MRRILRLHHLAEASNMPSIRLHGLLSTERLADLVGISSAERATLLRSHRDGMRMLADGVTIRDQCPMPPAALGPALDDGLDPGDWYALLNRFVFMWPDRERMKRQRRACGDRPQLVMTFDADALFEAFGDQASVSPINSGNARRKPARRGLGTLIPYAQWREHGWPTRARTHPPAEVLFGCAIPADAPFLLDVAGT